MKISLLPYISCLNSTLLLKQKYQIQYPMTATTETKLWEQYAKTKDEGYGYDNKYVSKMKYLSSGKREDILLVYGIMHLIDDVADNSKVNKAQRNKNVESFITTLRSSHPIEELDFLVNQMPIEALQTAIDSFNTSRKEYNLSLEPFFKLSEVLKLSNQWPDKPHFPNFKALEEFNDQLFTSVSECLSPILFDNLSELEQIECLYGFKHFMKGMQVVNILMDIEEDADLGHYFIPKDAFIPGNKISAATYLRFLDIGNSCFLKADKIFQLHPISPDVILFFKGLKDIYFRLISSSKILANVV